MEEELHNDSTSPSEQKKANKSFKDLVQDFAGYTTAHGIGRLGASETLFGKIFWSLCCLGAFFMFGFQATGLFQQYLSKPISTSVSVTLEKVCVWTGKYFIHMVSFTLLLPSCREIWNKCADNSYCTILLTSHAAKNAQVATSLLTAFCQQSCYINKPISGCAPLMKIISFRSIHLVCGPFERRACGTWLIKKFTIDINICLSF